MKDSDKLSCCNICLLATAMKTCPTCQFNPAHLKLTPAELDIVSHVELLKAQVKP